MLTSLMRREPPTLSRDPVFRAFEDFFNTDLFRPFGLREGLTERGWFPPVDVQEHDDEFVVTAELPGLAKKDVEITFENNILTMSGERRFEEAKDGNRYHRVERAYGSFSRSFTLPMGVDAEKVKADFKDGLLTIRLPKAEQARPRKISIT